MEIIDLWDSYSLKFNELSDKLAAAGIKINSLMEVLSAYHKLITH